MLIRNSRNYTAFCGIKLQLKDIVTFMRYKFETAKYKDLNKELWEIAAILRKLHSWKIVAIVRESQLRKIVEIKLIASHNYGKQSKKKKNLIYLFFSFVYLFAKSEFS